MKLDEILDKPLPYKVLFDGETYFRARFDAGDRTISFYAENEGALDDEDLGEWEIVFGENVGDGNVTFDLTKKGQEFAVFATLKELLTRLINKKNAKKFKFTADKSDKNRARVYARMFAKNLPQGWKIDRDDGYSHEPVLFQIVKEALDKPLPYTVIHRFPKNFDARFKAGNRPIAFSAEYSNDSVWEVSFYELSSDGATSKKTGSGNEFQVFATVKKIMDEFIHEYKPLRISIDSFKGEANRAKLYQRMIKKNLPDGWKMERDDDHPSYTSFVLIKEGMMKRSDPVVSGDKEGLMPWDRPAMATKPTTSHRSKLETLVKKSGKTMAQVEAAWNKAVKEVPEETSRWAKVMLRVKADLGISE